MAHSISLYLAMSPDISPTGANSVLRGTTVPGERTTMITDASFKCQEGHTISLYHCISLYLTYSHCIPLHLTVSGGRSRQRNGSASRCVARIGAAHGGAASSRTSQGCRVRQRPPLSQHGVKIQPLQFPSIPPQHPAGINRIHSAVVLDRVSAASSEHCAPLSR